MDNIVGVKTPTAPLTEIFYPNGYTVTLDYPDPYNYLFWS